MATVPLSLDVDADIARAFADLPTEQRRKIEVLLRLRLRELLTRPAESLTAVMDDIWRKATANGMTAEHLESALDEPRAPGGG